MKIEFSIAEPRAGDAVADCSVADAGGRLEVLSTGKRPAILGVEGEVRTLRAIAWSLVTSERAAKIRLQLAMARSFWRSLVVAVGWRVGAGARCLAAEDLSRSSTRWRLALESGLGEVSS